MRDGLFDVEIKPKCTASSCLYVILMDFALQKFSLTKQRLQNNNNNKLLKIPLECF